MHESKIKEIDINNPHQPQAGDQNHREIGLFCPISLMKWDWRIQKSRMCVYLWSTDGKNAIRPALIGGDFAPISRKTHEIEADLRQK